MDFSKIIEIIVKRLNISEEDAVAALASGASGFAIDSIFFVGGIPTPTATILFSIGGYASSRFFKNNRWYRQRTLANIDKLIELGHLDSARGKLMKDKLIVKWFKSVDDIDV